MAMDYYVVAIVQKKYCSITGVLEFLGKLTNV